MALLDHPSNATFPTPWRVDGQGLINPSPSLLGDWHLEPGEDSDVHRHELDHVLVQISGDRVAVAPEPDTDGPYRDYLEADIVQGAAVFVPRGGVETARNVGRQPYHEVIVELKD